MTDMTGALLDDTLVADDKITGVAMVTTGGKAGRLAVVKDDNDSAFYLVDPTKDLAAGLWVPILLSDGVLGTVRARDPTGITYIQNSASRVYEGHLAILADEEQAIYIVKDSGRLQATLDVSMLAANPQDVAHVPGTDVFLVVDADRSHAGAITFSGEVLFGYDLAAYGHHRTAAVAINQETCEQVVGNDGDGLLLGLDQVDYLGRVGALPATLERTLLLPVAADTFIVSDEAKNHGGENKLLVGRREAEQRTLILPDLSAVPAGSLGGA